jgi:predicted nuclease of predicted toxin-antitoxin system
VKFLVDRCAGHLLAEWLRGTGHDVIESRDLGPDPGDEQLLQIAHSQARVLITIDTDFGRLIFREHQEQSGLVRLPDVPAAMRIQIMQQILHHHSGTLEAGRIITVRGGRIRISRSK